MQQASDRPQAKNFSEWLFAQECVFVAGANNLAAIPDSDVPEIAFAGRSNVGKSSLVNALTGRKTLARTSQTPGRTKQINFFNLADKLMIVDLPGYGYADASKKEIAGWTKTVNGYLKGRPSLKRVCLLIDSRRGVKQTDIDIMKMLDDAAVVYQIILTKRDKVNGEEAAKVLAHAEGLAAKHPAMHPQVLTTSARERLGIAEIREELTAFAVS